jgi:hypothetical protein
VTSAPTHQVRVCEFMQPWPQHTRNSVPSPQGNLARLLNAAGLSGRSVCMQRYAAYAQSARSPWPRVPCVHARHVPFIRRSSLSLVSAPTDCRHCHVRCHTAPAAGPSSYVVASTRGSLALPCSSPPIQSSSRSNRCAIAGSTCVVRCVHGPKQCSSAYQLCRFLALRRVDLLDQR